ncbi:MAG TPA: prepilin peptidase [Thermoanaerobacterales bacterium]|nr:prepilin peptidase [Thermoanaerobacterales bacterium]
MLYLIVFILGLIVGSFLNVCIYRIPRGQSIVFPPSSCPSCGRRLKPLHMVPVLSFLLLGGKCAYCKEKISAVYPIVELGTAALYTFLLYRFSIGMLFFKYSLLFSILIVVCFIDMENQIIPDEIIIVGLLAGIIFSSVDKQNLLRDYIPGAMIGSGIILLIVILSRGGMGGGDIKLMAVIGIFLGWRKALLTLFISFILGGIFAFFLLITRKKGMKDTVPYGPFLGAAVIVTVFYYPYIVPYYFK